MYGVCVFVCVFCVHCVCVLCLALPCLALPCLALPCLALPCLALPCLALPCLACLLACAGSLSWLLSWLLSCLLVHLLACRTFNRTYFLPCNLSMLVPLTEAVILDGKMRKPKGTLPRMLTFVWFPAYFWNRPTRRSPLSESTRLPKAAGLTAIALRTKLFCFTRCPPFGEQVVTIINVYVCVRVRAFACWYTSTQKTVLGSHHHGLGALQTRSGRGYFQVHAKQDSDCRLLDTAIARIVKEQSDRTLHP